MIKNPHEVIKGLEMGRLPELSELALSLITFKSNLKNARQEGQRKK